MFSIVYYGILFVYKRYRCMLLIFVLQYVLCQHLLVFYTIETYINVYRGTVDVIKIVVGVCVSSFYVESRTVLSV